MDAWTLDLDSGPLDAWTMEAWMLGELCKIFKNTFYYRTTSVAAFVFKHSRIYIYIYIYKHIHKL